MCKTSLATSLIVVDFFRMTCGVLPVLIGRAVTKRGGIKNYCASWAISALKNCNSSLVKRPKISFPAASQILVMRTRLLTLVYRMIIRSPVFLSVVLNMPIIVCQNKKPFEIWARAWKADNGIVLRLSLKLQRADEKYFTQCQYDWLCASYAGFPIRR